MMPAAARPTANDVEIGSISAGEATGAADAGAVDGTSTTIGIEGLQLFEFNAKTAPTKRHKLIKDFQEGSKEGAKVFVVTYRTAAVGITLTAANRVYLFEPALDPGQEVQAAGRIHRLGQDKEVLVKRFAFRNSIEEAVLDLHAKIASGEIVMVDGKFPKEAKDLFKKYGINQPHDFHPEDGQRLGQSSAPISTQLAKAEAAVATQQLMPSPRLRCRCDG